MAHDKDLFGKTFDQQLQAAGGQISEQDISPNRRVPGEIVFEPAGSGVRVTARDAQHRVLWGYVGSKETVRNVHCLVAIYDTLQGLLAEELEKRGLSGPEAEDPMTAASGALDRMEQTLKRLRESLAVRKVSEATLERARSIARTVADADQQIALATSTLRTTRP